MIRLRATVSRRARSLSIGGALVLVCLAVAWAHAAPVAHEMNAMGDDEMATAVSICLAVLGAGAGLLAAVLGAAIVGRRRPPRSLGPTAPGLLIARPALIPPVAARAGPAVLQVFRS